MALDNKKFNSLKTEEDLKKLTIEEIGQLDGQQSSELHRRFGNALFVKYLIPSRRDSNPILTAPTAVGPKLEKHNKPVKKSAKKTEDTEEK